MSLIPFMPLIDKALSFIPNSNDRAKAKEQLEQAEQKGELDIVLGQISVNRQEAAHKSIFVAGWRPFIGWVCGVGLAYNVIVSPILDIWLAMPEVDPSLLYPVLLGMLGLGGMRSYEKFKGVAREK